MEDKEKLIKENDKLKKDFDELQKKSQQEMIDAQKKHTEDVLLLTKKHEEAVTNLAKKIQKESVTPMTDTVAKAQAETLLNDAKPQSVTALNIGFATATPIPGVVTPAYHPNDVKFEVTDPKETGMQKGITVVSRESAEHFESKGFGKIVK